MSDFVAPWTLAHQAPLSMEFSRQEYWNGLPFPSPRDLPNPGVEPRWLSGKESETPVQSLGREDPMEKGMATHSSILAWEMPWTEDPGGL